jgi:hypothetical protein
MGFFQVLGPVTSFTDTVLATFSLSLTQVAPVFGAGTETLTSSVAGTIKKSNSQLFVTFTSGSGPAVPTVTPDPVRIGVASLSFQLGDVIYWVDQRTALLPQNAFGISGLDGAISSMLPEPAFYALTGCGLFGMFFMAVRRRRQTA